MRRGHADSIVTAQSEKFFMGAKNSNKCVGRAKRKQFSSPVNASLSIYIVLIGVLGEFLA